MELQLPWLPSVEGNTITMDHPHAQPPTLREVLRSIQQHKRLIAIVETMAREIERLEEDNRQLRAAVGVYREVVRRRGPWTHVERPRNARAAAMLERGLAGKGDLSPLDS